MNQESDSVTDADRLDEVLAGYMEEAEAFKDNLSELCALQTKYVEKHPDLATQLLNHFENENVVLSGFGRIPCRLADFGKYTQIRYMGHGGMGVVYKAFDQELKVSIALKLSLPGALMGEPSVERFRNEAQSMARLKHPNIVRVRYVGEHEGRPFLDMELAGGGNLAQHRERFAADQRSAAKLMVQVARAVHHAHQRRILHRDLKPANILLDPDENESTQDKPYVTDFGLALEIGADGFPVDTGGELGKDSQVNKTIAGTAGYMSPEQATEGKDATTLSDVYGLGATLYSLQTGKSPFGASTVKETLRQVRDPSLNPKSPRAIDPGIDRTLEAVCLKCLQKDPNDRYKSAEGTAKDLERWLAHRPTRARPLSRLGRSGLWSRRNPLGVGLALMILAFLTLAGVIIAELMGGQDRALLALARQNAGTLHLRLEQLREAVEVARDPRHGELLTQRNFTGLQALIEETGNRRVDLNGKSPFESWFIIDDSNGEIAARWPASEPQTQSKDRRYRDYYKGALLAAKTRGGTPVYVSRVYEATLDGLYKLGVSAAVGYGGKIVGAVVASVTTSPQMGLPQTENSEFTTALLARGDPPERGRPWPPDGASEFLVLFHPAYERGTQPVWISTGQAGRIGKSIADNNIAENYHDPVVSLSAEVAEKYGGRWVAGFAPVEDSEFIVVVQRRYSETIPAEWQPWIVVLLVTSLAVAIVWFVMPPASSRR